MTSKYLIVVADENGDPDFSYGMKGDAEEINDALSAAWTLNRYTERDTVVCEWAEEIGPSQFSYRGCYYSPVARVKVEWIEEM